MTGVEFAAAAVLGLVGNRLRGGLIALPGGDLPARAIGALIGAGAVAALAGLGWWSLGVAAAALAGDMISGAGGQYGTAWTLPAFGRMWFYAIERTAGLLLPMIVALDLVQRAEWLPALWLLAAIILCPVCYALAPYWPVSIPWLGIKARNRADSGFGEALWGAVLGVAIFAACGVKL
ncbi:MAG: hypothetical protein PHZ23_16350 [Acidiphilium sp.]|nr:hypothetical protein [Acidiphilium sp.]